MVFLRVLRLCKILITFNPVDIKWHKALDRLAKVSLSQIIIITQKIKPKFGIFPYKDLSKHLQIKHVQGQCLKNHISQYKQDWSRKF